MNTKKDKPTIKLYKDLMITRRDLIDLRESINNTINSIKEADQRLQIIEIERKMIKQAREQQKSNAHHLPSTSYLKMKAKCQHCHQAFFSNQALAIHRKQKHQICEDCKREYNNTLEEHLQFTCGEAKIECECCNNRIKKIELNTHVKICCYRQCYKCKEDIYFRAYAFHLLECKRTQNLIVPCRILHQRKRSAQSMALPCCLAIQP